MDLAQFLGLLEAEIESNPTKYQVSPQQAYIAGGSQRGELVEVKYPDMTEPPPCRNCKHNMRAYSQAGADEAGISGMCEPCFDSLMLHPDDREANDQWMTLVKIKKDN